MHARAVRGFHKPSNWFSVHEYLSSTLGTVRTPHQSCMLWYRHPSRQAQGLECVWARGQAAAGTLGCMDAALKWARHPQPVAAHRARVLMWGSSSSRRHCKSSRGCRRRSRSMVVPVTRVGASPAALAQPGRRGTRKCSQQAP